jgi:hypothetical protein
MTGDGGSRDRFRSAERTGTEGRHACPAEPGQTWHRAPYTICRSEVVLGDGVRVVEPLRDGWARKVGLLVASRPGHEMAGPPAVGGLARTREPDACLPPKRCKHGTRQTDLSLASYFFRFLNSHTATPTATIMRLATIRLRSFEFGMD